MIELLVSIVYYFLMYKYNTIDASTLINTPYLRSISASST